VCAHRLQELQTEAALRGLPGTDARFPSIEFELAVFAGQSVAVVVPAKDEELTIGEVVGSFVALECVDRVIVVDNNCVDATAERARDAGGETVAESRPGYGSAITAGLNHAFGTGSEIAIVTEADGSFAPRDAWKLLHYLDDGNLILGTRTTRQMIEQAANMNLTLRLGNLAMAKLLELLWWWPNEPRLTDVGCTYRALRKDTWETLRPLLRETGPAFSPEMIAHAYNQALRVVEIPVNYRARRGGDSKHTANFRGAAETALSMFRTICRVRWQTLSHAAGAD
jgi:glycosyltransferase involved in cell wall biosynthesis